MKKILKVIGNVFIGLGIAVGIALSAWFLWQVMPANPHHDEWIWNFPPFPFALLVLFVGICPMIIILLVGFVLGLLIKGLAMSLFEKLWPLITGLVKNVFDKIRKKQIAIPQGNKAAEP